MSNKISIVIVSKGNPEDYEYSKLSIDFQTYKNFEIVQVETDNQSDIDGSQHSDYRVVASKNSSFYHACNLIIPSLKGDYCFFMKAGECLNN
ncbi:MAG: glycosyltransferase family A protein, partial [Paludibacter sp.]